jgi:hypothetical protein
MDLLREKARARSAHRLQCSDAPDMTAMNIAAQTQAELGREALNWYKDLYAQTAPDRERASAAALEQSTLQSALARESLTASQEARGRYNSTFKPIEDRIAAEAMAYDTPARREAAAKSATADVEMTLAGARDATQRNQARMGVMPNSGQAAAMAGAMDLGAAKLKAGAANTARREVETIGQARLMDAAGLGKGVVSNQATQAQLGITAGNSGVNNAQVPLNVANQGAQIMGQGFQTGMQGNMQAGQLYGQAAQIGQSNNDGLWGALGTMGGAALGNPAIFKSDENEKEGVSAVNDAEAL